MVLQPSQNLASRVLIVNAFDKERSSSSDKQFLGKKRHKEIFALQRAGKNHRYHNQEWELVVKEIVHKWGKFVEEHIIQD